MKIPPLEVYFSEFDFYDAGLIGSLSGINTAAQLRYFANEALL